jgi:non-lysosomal glucosylceramidase
MTDSQDNVGCAGDCGCRLPRRTFLQLGGLGAVALLARNFPAMAGPFEAADLDHLVPADKKLSAEWIKSLYERGAPRVYRGDELRFIGMPVSGITTGQLYLGGDGRLWHWDIFNRIVSTSQAHYANPVSAQSPLEQGFLLTVRSPEPLPARSLDARGFKDVSFVGQYPIGKVEYRDSDCPLEVTLEAFSPFIPLNVADSSIPATILQFTLKNSGATAVETELAGDLQNAVLGENGAGRAGFCKNSVVREGGELLMVECSAEETVGNDNPRREPIVFEDFEGADYGSWTVEGTAFGKGPAHGAPDNEQKLRGFIGKSLVNSWQGTDQAQGKLTSRAFVIERKFINFLIGGGHHPKQTCINLVLDGKVVRSQTGDDSDAMQWATWGVRDLVGKTAHLEIVDHSSGGWGHIDIDQIEFSDTSRTAKPLNQSPDFGTMAIALLQPADADRGVASVSMEDGKLTEDKIDSKPFGEKLIGALVRKISLQPGETSTVTFVVTWCFPNLEMRGIKGGAGRHYATRFASAKDVAKYMADHFDRLASETRRWRDTWYDSTLPHWFLDRTHLNVSILATSTAYRFANGRFYGWEGVGCCDGTCTHVWHYGQAMGRLFPELEVLLRERADFNPDIGMNSNGMIDHRGEFHAGQAVDGQAGIILRAYRDHQMSSDDAFLKRNYVSIKKAMGWLIAQDALDGQEDGILQGAQHNTLDAEWYGPVAWLSGLYLASLRAMEQMATEMGDNDFAAQCRHIFEIGQKKFVATLFDGEYFINKPDPKHRDSINSGTGCEIDQVFGQSWAFQVGLGRILPESQTRSALQSLWKYNFSPDVGVYRKVNKPGRWYAMAGEAGMLMCTFPRSDWSYENAKGKGPEWATGYFNECMNGFEHQVAGHMIWEGMVQEGLSVERAIHDRYDAARRNPWNEVECGDHYARSMASYGVFIAACGYEYHGPNGSLAFAPRLTPENFKAAFTSAQGWGTFAQQINGAVHDSQLEINWGKLRLTELTLTPAPNLQPKGVSVFMNGKQLGSAYKFEDGRIKISLAVGAILEKSDRLEVKITGA